jgi:CHAT domain-containing protein
MTNGDGTRAIGAQTDADEGLVETQLWEAVMNPVLGRIPGGVGPGECGNRHLVLSPDGELTQLPFEVLLDADGRRLIDDYRISYLSAGRDLLRWGRGATRLSGRSVVVGDPDFDLSDCEVAAAPTSHRREARSSDLEVDPLVRLNRLPETRDEALAIASEIDADVWLGDAAVESAIKARRNPYVLHIASHGLFLEDDSHGGRVPERLRTISSLANPMLRSMVCLAGAQTFIAGGSPPQAAEDGLLTAEDVVNLDLSETELVVLSACDTGRGAVNAGDGVFGLRRAFAIAGARTLIMSLWKVPDYATRLLMVRFYEELRNGAPRAEALLHARQWVRDRYPHPYYWSAFILQGEADRVLPLGFRDTVASSS